MKIAPLPETIHPARLALSGEEIVGSIRVSELNRLKQLLASELAVLSCKISVDRDQQGRLIVSGSIDAVVEMDCQLCLKPMEVPLQQIFELMVVESDEQAAEVLENHEPLQLETDSILLKSLLEDEAILALPLAPSHDLAEACQQHKYFSVEAESKQPLETKQPFANLKDLMAQSTENKD